MKTLLTIMVLTNSEESPNIVCSARLAHAKKSRVFAAKQAGLFFATLLLLKKRIASLTRRTSRRSATFMKGERYGNFNVHCKSLGLFVDSRRGRLGISCHVEKLVRHPCLEFERIIDITDKLTKWIKKVKKIILSREKMFNRK